MGDTIYALSSGRPPAGIAVIRVSGPRAFDVAEAMAGDLPAERSASLRRFRDVNSGEELDQGILLVAAAPNTATGENIAEFQCHGGRATINAMLSALGRIDGLRMAEPGEFTRQALANGRIDLTEAEGLADLLAAETELQRKVALRRSEGAVRREIDLLSGRLLSLAGVLEIAIDYVDEDDGASADLPLDDIRLLAGQIRQLLGRAPAERLRNGVRVVIAGPPNAGKSSLLNTLVGQDRAIVTDIPGTTRDSIEVPIDIAGVPIVLVDTAGLRESDDAVERIGIDRASAEATSGDLVIWMGEAGDAPPGAIVVHGKADIERTDTGLPFSAVTGEGREELLGRIGVASSRILPSKDSFALTARERDELHAAYDALERIRLGLPLEIAAEQVRQARESLDRITGQAGVEDMLDALFSRFCVGK